MELHHSFKSCSSIRLLIPPEHVRDGLEDDKDVEPEAPVFDVPDVALDAALHLVEGLGLAAEAGDLAPAGDAGLDVVADHVLVDELGIFLGVLEHVGAGADNAHLAEQNVDELRKLVKAGVAHDLAPACDAGIALRGLQAVGLGVDFHAAELEAGELLTVESGALLAEEHGAGHRELRHDGHDQQYGDEEQREHYVEHALDDAVLDPAERLVAKAQAGHAAHHYEMHLPVDVVAHVRHAVEAHYVVLAVSDDGHDQVLMSRRQTAEQGADLVVVLLHVGNDLLRRSEIRAVRGEFGVRFEIEIAEHLVTHDRVVCQLLEKSGIVLGASDKHYAVPAAGMPPIALQHETQTHPESGDQHKHGQQAQQPLPPQRHQEVSKQQQRGGQYGEQHHVAQHQHHDLNLARLLDVQDYPAVDDARIPYRADKKLRLELRGGSRGIAVTESEPENQITEQQVAYHDDEPEPGTVPVADVIYSWIHTFFTVNFQVLPPPCAFPAPSSALPMSYQL